MRVPFAVAVLVLLAVPAQAETLSLTAAKAQALKDPYSGRPTVTVELTAESREELARLTQANVGRQIEVRVKGQVLSSPLVHDPITGGRFNVSGGMSEQQAEALATALDDGTPIEIKTLPQPAR